jgi:hypothetical protein
MSTGVFVILLVALLAAGTLLAGRAGIRSIQQARKVVFYRTRRSHMLAGWQWLALALVLFSGTVASALFGESAANQLFPQAVPPTVTPTQIPLSSATLLPSPTQTNTPTSTFHIHSRRDSHSFFNFYPNPDAESDSYSNCQRYPVAYSIPNSFADRDPHYQPFAH